jgi:multiple sugar transport system permease protein
VKRHSTRLGEWLESEKISAMILVAPSILLLLLLAVYPTFEVLRLSLRRVMPIFGIDEYVGLANYRLLWEDARFWNALGNTVYFTAVAVSIELVLGLLLALGLQRRFPGRPLVRVAILIPWAIPTVVSAKLWGWLFNPDFGLINHLLGTTELDWMGSPTLAIHAAILVDVWKTTPFVALLLLAGLQVIPEQLYKAARVDGASSWRMFREITLPLLAPAIGVTLLFRTLDAFRVFDAVFVLTGGGPANTTETLSIYAYKVLFTTLQFGYGSTLAVVTFGCVVAISSLYMGLLMRGAGGAGR